MFPPPAVAVVRDVLERLTVEDIDASERAVRMIRAEHAAVIMTDVHHRE